MAVPSKLAAGSPFNMHLLYEEGGDIKAATVQSTTGVVMPSHGLQLEFLAR